MATPPSNILNFSRLHWLTVLQIWDLFEGRHLFSDIFDESGCHDPFRHMAQIASYIGPPPLQFVQRSETTMQCFSPDGKLFLVLGRYFAP